MDCGGVFFKRSVAARRLSDPRTASRILRRAPLQPSAVWWQDGFIPFRSGVAVKLELPPRVVVGVSGGSGMIYAKDLLRTLQDLPAQTHVVITSGAKQVIPTELDETSLELEAFADTSYKDTDLGAAISSGSFRTAGMVITPCSAGTLAKVAQGMADNLLSRAAHVTLKERRPLVLVLREAPFSRPMLHNMLAAHDAGATIMPASPGFYHRPTTIGELVSGVTARTLDLLGIDNARAPRWKDT